LPAAALQYTGTFLCHIDDVDDGECDESGRQRGAKRATSRAARVMVMAMRVVGDDEGESGKTMVTATTTRVAGLLW